MLSLVGKVALFVRHEYFLHPKSGSLQEVSREPVHIYSGAVTASVYASITVVTFYCSYKFIVGAAASMSEVAFRNPPLNPFIIHKNPTPYWLIRKPNHPIAIRGYFAHLSCLSIWLCSNVEHVSPINIHMCIPSRALRQSGSFA